MHFAHAAVYLMRSLGIPSRVATGYAVDPSARQGGSALLLSGANGHAWPEIYVEGWGWTVLDVAPQHTVDAPPPAPDRDLQRLLGELARGKSTVPPDVTADVQSAMASVRLWARRVGFAVLFAILAVLIAAFVVKVWRRVAPAVVPEHRLPRVLYRAELDRLAEVGLTRRRGESRESFAARLEAAHPAFVGLTQAHVGAAFGAAHTDLSAMRSDAARFRADLRGRVPLWRRALGWLDPSAWLRAR